MSFATGNLPAVVASERVTTMSGMTNFGSPLDTLPRRPVVSNTSEGLLSSDQATAASAPTTQAPPPQPPTASGDGQTFDPKTGGATTGANTTRALTPAEQATLVKRAMAPGVSVAVGNVSGLDSKGQPIVTTPATHYGGNTPAPSNEIPTFQNFRMNVANDAASGRVAASQAGNPIGTGPNGAAIYGAS